MSIANYSDLQTAIAGWLHRSDLTANIPDFISLAEAKINRRLRIRAQEDTATGNVAASVQLPTDFAELIALTVTTGGVTYPVSYKHPSAITGDSASTFYYTIIGDNIVFDPVGTGFTYTLTYYAKFAALSAGVNWLITNAPDVYLYAALMEAAPYLNNDARTQVWATLLDNAIADLEHQDRNAAFGNNLRMVAA